MREQIALQNLLRSNFLELQAKNNRYSLRAYAKRVGVHVGALSSIMNGKRSVSRDLAERIARRLLVDPQKRVELLDLFPQIRRPVILEDGRELTSKYLELEATQFKTIAEWEHFAVLSLMKTKDFDESPNWIANRLGVAEKRVSDVLKNLLAASLIKYDENNKLIRVHAAVRTSDDTVNLALRKSHEVTLELAKESLNRDSVSERDFTYITMPIDPRKISVAKELIRKFQDELSEMLESGNQTEVYRFSTQLIPITKLKK